MITLKAKDYVTRSDLENAIRQLIGLTPEAKDTHIIKGTKVELANIGLSDKTIFWGIKCVITDDPTPINKQTEEKPARGEAQPFGLNGNLNNPK